MHLLFLSVNILYLNSFSKEVEIFMKLSDFLQFNITLLIRFNFLPRWKKNLKRYIERQRKRNKEKEKIALN